jgi:hypothetical protein
MFTFKQTAKYGSTALALAALSTASQAAAIDVSAVVSEIQGTSAPIALIAGAVLIVIVGIAAWKYVRRAL